MSSVVPRLNLSMTTPLANGDSNLSAADGGGRASARGQNSFSMVSPRPLSARLDGQGSEGDIKHELFEVRKLLRQKETEIMQYAAQVDVLQDALAEKDGVIKAKLSEVKLLRDTNSSIQASHQRDQVLVRRLESRLSEVELEKSNAQDAHRGGQYGHLPLQKQVHHLRAENIWLLQYFERFRFSLESLLQVAELSLECSTPDTSAKLRQLLGALERLQDEPLAPRPALSLTSMPPPSGAGGGGAAAYGPAFPPPPSSASAMSLSDLNGAGGGGDSRALEIEIRRLNSELKSLKSSKQEQESSLRAQNDRIHKLTAKFDTLSSVTRDALLRRSSALPPVATGDTSQYSSLRLKFLEHEQRLFLPIECFDLLEREIFALRQDLAEREDALRERVDEIERLTRAVDVLKHAREVDRRAASLQSKK